jgi:uncharacterized protein (DUF1501 family)
MKRRNFVKNLSLSSLTVPFMFKDFHYEGIAKELFKYSKSADNKVLVIIRLNGGNDGLNTLIPRDQYENLVLQRQNILLPESAILPLTAATGLHSAMSGMANLFQDGKLSVIQNVGYPEQNRSHFRSMDIWTSGMLSPTATTGWMGRKLDSQFPDFPAAYPNTANPDPFAISMGYEVSATCQGLMGNFSTALNDPFETVDLEESAQLNDGTYYGSHMEYLSTLISQTNAYADQVNAAANAGNTLSQLYDDENPLAVQLRYVAQMISGGLQTKVYVLNMDGFDTHDSQVANNNVQLGNHAELLKILSDAIAAFQDDLNLLQIDSRVAGMTFSEFGRQVASNASFGTDHGDAAPLFLFGSCIESSILGPNPVIPDEVQDQAGVPMQIDFRDVYASILKDWFEVAESEVQAMFEHEVTFYDLLGACTLGIDEFGKPIRSTTLVYPNPCGPKATLKLDSKDEWVKIDIYDLQGRHMQAIYDGNLSPDTHHIPLELGDYAIGNYRVVVQKASGNESIQFLRVRSN